MFMRVFICIAIQYLVVVGIVMNSTLMTFEKILYHTACAFVFTVGIGGAYHTVKSLWFDGKMILGIYYLLLFLDLLKQPRNQ